MQYYIRILKGTRDRVVGDREFPRRQVVQIQCIFDTGDHFCIFPVIHIPCIVLGWWLASGRQSPYKPALVVYIIITLAEEPGVPKCRGLSCAQKVEGSAVLVPEVFWTRLHFNTPVFLVPILRSHSALPTVVFAQLVGHRQALGDN